MRCRLSWVWLTALAALLPQPTRAQEEAPPAAAAYEPPAASPTLESLQADLRKLQTRHDQELQELRTELAQKDAERAVAGEREAADRERLLRIYGFADMGMMRTERPEDELIASQFTIPLTFYFGHLNIYYDSHPDPDFRFLAETRLSLYPNGTSPGVSSTGQVLRTSTTVNDISSPNPTATVSWGGIILERAALDWTRYPLFSIRAGLFLTPFGVYNVDHGTPTLIAATVPTYIGQGWIPTRQLGLQVFGSQPVERWELGYNATVSNGRTDGVLDVDDSKTYGGRLFARRHGELGLLVGASAIYQPYRRDREQYGMDASGNVTYSTTRVVEKTMLTLGNDISVDFRGLRVRHEIVMVQSRYSPGKRDTPAQAQGGLDPDSRQYNWSMTVAYRYWNVEPYATSEVFYCSPSQSIATKVFSPGLGMNLYLRPAVILKLNWTGPHFYKDNDPDHRAARRNFNEYLALLTWAF
jgi:hypothetical protein